MKPLEAERILEKPSLRAVVTLIILIMFLGSYLFHLRNFQQEIVVDTDTFKLLLQTLLTLLSVAVGGWLFKEAK